MVVNESFVGQYPDRRGDPNGEASTPEMVQQLGGLDMQYGVHADDGRLRQALICVADIEVVVRRTYLAAFGGAR